MYKIDPEVGSWFHASITTVVPRYILIDIHIGV